MNREIKFRAWDKNRQTMVTSPNRLSIAWVNGMLTVFDHNQSGVRIECVLMQYTGLKDKNGKEIYEGDVLKIEVANEFGSASADVGYVVFHSEAAQFVITKDGMVTNIGMNAEVIGNIYQNPELI